MTSRNFFGGKEPSPEEQTIMKIERGFPSLSQKEGNREVGALFDLKTGNVIGDVVVGEHHYIPLSRFQEQGVLEGRALSHFHPSGTHVPSIGDIMCYLSAKPVQLRTVTEKMITVAVLKDNITTDDLMRFKKELSRIPKRLKKLAKHSNLEDWDDYIMHIRQRCPWFIVEYKRYVLDAD